MLKKLKTPLILIIVFVSFILLWNLFDLPQDGVLIEMAKGYFEKYGLVTVLLAAIIEGALVVGWYLPGGLVIFLGVILASGDPYRATLSVVSTIVGFCIANTFNYFLGRHGWYRLLTVFGLKDSLQKAEGLFQKYGYRAMLISYWQPNLAALVSTSAGVLKAPFKNFFVYSTLATILWSAFWGITAYILGQKILEYLGIVFFAIMIIWVISIIVGHYRNKAKNRDSHY